MKQIKTSIKTSITTVFILLMLSSPLMADNLKKQIKAMNKEFEAHTFTSLNRLIFKSKYHVTADGDTWGAEKGQGKISFLTVKGAVAFNEGDTAKQVWIKQKSDKEIMVRMFCCGNRERSLRTTAHVDLYIHSDQDFTSEVVTKQMIATAISGFFDVEGFNDDKAKQVLEDLAQDLSGSNSNNQPQFVAKDTVNSLVIDAKPKTLSAGESTTLSMTFNIGTINNNAVTVEESSTLSFQGNTLPGYPVIKSNSRNAGEYTTQFSQTIPAGAAKGIYKYKAEVCVAEDCISKQMEIIIE